VPPSFATLVFIVGIAGLFLLDRDRESRTSPAIWIAVIWVCIAGSRMVSQWMYPTPGNQSPDAYLDGSPIDRILLTGLMAAGVAVLVARARRLETVLLANGPLVVFFLYCGASVVWSDYPDVAFKRWTKTVGDLVMVMLALTSSDPVPSIKRVLSRAAFVLLPLSVLLIKYYPELGRGYNRWNWGSFYVGVANEKNGLGYICLILGLGSLWQFIAVWQSEPTSERRRRLVAHGVVLAMTLWLFWMADSVTALVCFLLGATLLVFTSARPWIRTPAAVHSLVATIAIVVACGVLLGSGAGLAQAMGRDTTLTGRTQLWSYVLDMIVDPLFGTGFESFWLGDRVETIWRLYWWRPNQAHNGYIEVFLNLGVIGLGLLAVLMISTYRRIAHGFRDHPEAAALSLAYFVVAIVYNFTEAAIKGFHPVWIAFLIAVTLVPSLAASRPKPVWIGNPRAA
jgi:exopolysaccharide production protein ExoQ